MEKVNQYELGKKLYHDWRLMPEYNESYETVRRLGKGNVDINELQRGFIDERIYFLKKQPDDDDIECFYGAMDEIGIDYWG